jgi:hypothetical protein
VFKPAQAFPDEKKYSQAKIADQLNKWGKANPDHLQELYARWVNKYGADERGPTTDWPAFQKWVVGEVRRRAEVKGYASETAPEFIFGTEFSKIMGFLQGQGIAEPWYRPNVGEPQAPVGRG